MKHLFIALTLIASVVSKNSKATETSIPAVISRSFQHAFKNSTNVVWSEVQPLYKASFSFNGQELAAFFDPGGELVALSKKLAVEQLPLFLQKNLENDYGSSVAYNCFEVDNEAGISYYITVENKKAITQLKAMANENWYVYKRTYKKSRS